uniref:NADH-ubiquinone oxidoreductase chain 6 n=1 Tax=Coptotettix longtanensis TaxID=510004 RepID=A0A8K1VDK0_9ORTH|nr:NADH dehydrogenase subunit 6 [Coptotettix longtanensis]
MKMIITTSTMLSILFMKTKQPMQMIIIILIQTLMATMMMSVKTKSSWFMYILMIVFIGGMMVIFIYITSITPNEKSEKILIKTMIFTMMIMMTALLTMKNPEFINTETLNMESMNMLKTEYTMLNKAFNTPMYMISITMMMYLFIALIAVNKISNMKKGPLRKMN